MSATKLFGTDGIRGTANTEPMTPDLVMRVGQAIGYILKNQPTTQRKDHPMVLIGKDTRLSGYMLEQALSSGLNSMGVFVQLTGPLPTPGIGFLARNMRADAGIIISASHNAYYDNGIKVFGADGFKISADMEVQIEQLVADNDMNRHLSSPDKIGRSRRIDDAAGRYIVYAKNTFPLDMSLDAMRIVLDCANGASYKVAPAIFEELGAEVIVLGNQPNGFNINDKVGALYPERMCEAVKQYRADVGISLDGDADRVIMADEKGELVNGDHILSVCALYMNEKGLLPENTIVATQMSNLGLDIALKAHGIQVLRTDVGDKYVVEEMRKKGLSLGGEQSGHIIHLDHSTTGDGCVAALNVLAVMKSKGKKLSLLKKIFKEYPQVLINRKVKFKKPLEEISGFAEMLKDVEKKLGSEGRTFIRYSGTEPVIRVLVEGKDRRLIGKCAEDLASHLQKELS
jgi:phosphoglucosamine mutase